MNFENAKLLYVLSVVLLGFIILLPSIFAVIPFPEGERFSELWLLGPNRLIESSTFNVSIKQPHTFYLGVGNKLGDLEYYQVYVKLRNQFEALSDTIVGLPSPLEPVFEYNLFMRNNDTWEQAFEFSFEEGYFEENIWHISKLSIDDYDLMVDKIIAWDEENNGFYCQLLFELWIYNTTTSDFQYHNRYVSVWLNMTQTY